MVVMNSPVGSLGGLRLVPLHDVLQREHVFQQHVPAGPIAHEDDVVVRVDQAGDRRCGL